MFHALYFVNRDDDDAEKSLPDQIQNGRKPVLILIHVYIIWQTMT